DGLEKIDLGEPHDVRVARIDRQRGVIPGALSKHVVAARSLPVLTAIVRSEEPPAVSLDQRVYAATIRRGNGHAHLAPDATWQPLIGELLPSVAAVAGDVEPAAGAAAHQLPGAPPGLPEPGEDDAWVGWVERDVRGARILIFLEHKLPRLA